MLEGRYLGAFEQAETAMLENETPYMSLRFQILGQFKNGGYEVLENTEVRYVRIFLNTEYWASNKRKLEFLGFNGNVESSFDGNIIWRIFSALFN